MGGARLALEGVLSGGQVPLDEGDIQVSQDDLYVDRATPGVGAGEGRAVVGITEHPCSLLPRLTRVKCGQNAAKSQVGRVGNHWTSLVSTLAAKRQSTSRKPGKAA